MKKFSKVLVVMFVVTILVSCVVLLTTDDTNKVKAETTTYVPRLAIPNDLAVAFCFATGDQSAYEDGLTTPMYFDGTEAHVLTLESNDPISIGEDYYYFYTINQSLNFDPETCYFMFRGPKKILAYSTGATSKITFSDLPTEEGLVAVVASADSTKLDWGNDVTCTWTKPIASLKTAKIAKIFDQKYNGGTEGPELTVTCNGKTLVKDTDYTVAFTNLDQVGTATATLTGIGNYCGETTATFKVVQTELLFCTVASVPNQYYTGEAIVPELNVTYGNYTLKLGTDYIIKSASNNVEIAVGNSANLLLAGQGGFSSTRYVYFHIGKVNFSDAAFSLASISDQGYTGEEIKPVVQVQYNSENTSKYVENVDYTVSYENNVNAGEATVTITGIGNCEGTTTQTFKINPKAISACTFEGYSNAVSYIGTEHKPSVSVSLDGTALIENTDYTLTYTDNINAGIASITVSGKGNYTGNAALSFVINKVDLASSVTIGSIEDQIYTEEALTPDVVLTYGNLTLVKDVDFTLSYENNVELGTATITITGMGNFEGTATTTFNIVKKSGAGVIAAIAIPVAILGGGASYVYFDLMKGKGMTLSQVVSTGTTAITNAGKSVGTFAKNLVQKVADTFKNLFSKFKK